MTAGSTVAVGCWRLLPLLARVHRRAVLGSVAFCCLLVALAYLQLSLAAASADPIVDRAQAMAQGPGYAPFLVMSLLAVLGPPLAIVVGALVVSSPFRWRVLTSEVAHHGNAVTMLSRLALVWVSSLLCLAVGVSLALLVATVMTGVGGTPSGPGVGQIVPQAGVVVLGMGMWGTAAAAVVMWTRNGVLGVVLPIVEATVELMLPITAMSAFLPATAQRATLQEISFLPPGATIVSGPFTAPVASTLWGVLVAVVVTGALTASCLARMRRGTTT